MTDNKPEDNETPADDDAESLARAAEADTTAHTGAPALIRAGFHEVAAPRTPGSELH